MYYYIAHCMANLCLYLYLISEVLLNLPFTFRLFNCLITKERVCCTSTLLNCLVKSNHNLLTHFVPVWRIKTSRPLTESPISTIVSRLALWYTAMFPMCFPSRLNEKTWQSKNLKPNSKLIVFTIVKFFYFIHRLQYIL